MFFLEFEFILFLLCSLMFNHDVTLAVLFVYPVTIPPVSTYYHCFQTATISCILMI